MSVVKEVQELALRKVPEVRVGHTVKIHEKIKEGNKERVQTFEGLVIKLSSGFGADKTFTVRRLVGGFGVEKIFPMFSPLIQIELVKIAKIRRAKLYYMRERSGKSARLKETLIAGKDAMVAPDEIEEEILPTEEVMEETPVVEETAAPEEAIQEEVAAEEAPAEETPETEEKADKSN
jgi:large subunit ribosomal protein L19